MKKVNSGGGIGKAASSTGYLQEEISQGDRGKNTSLVGGMLNGTYDLIRWQD